MMALLGARPICLRIELIADGKHQLQILILRHGGYDGAEDVDATVQDRPH